MALKIAKTDNKGIPTTYHRIEGVNLTDDKAQVIIASYSNSNYRDSEKTSQINLKERERLIDLIQAEMQKDEEERDAESIKCWTEQANDLVATSVMLDFIISKETVELPFSKSESMSFRDLYNRLKELPEYQDAEDI